MTIVLEAPAARLEVSEVEGGRWTSLRVGDLELLGGAHIPGAYPPTLFGVFPMAPYAGRVREGVLTWEGRTVVLPRTDPPHAIHGTVLDVPWEGAAEGGRAALGVDLDRRWPWRGRVEQRLELGEDFLTCQLVLQAQERMPAWLGLHPWFRRRLARGGEAQLSLQAGLQVERGSDHLPTGRLVEPGTPPFDDCFGEVSQPPSVRWPGALELECSSSAAWWVRFDELPEAVCLEPQTAPPDAVNLGLAEVVEAGEELSLELTLRWRRLA